MSIGQVSLRFPWVSLCVMHSTFLASLLINLLGPKWKIRHGRELTNMMSFCSKSLKKTYTPWSPGPWNVKMCHIFGLWKFSLYFAFNNWGLTTKRPLFFIGHRSPIQENSAKLTNQRVSYAFTSSLLSFHARHILPTSKFQHSYSCVLLIFCISEQNVWVWI